LILNDVSAVSHVIADDTPVVDDVLRHTRMGFKSHLCGAVAADAGFVTKKLEL
jgi:hypothetical protein